MNLMDIMQWHRISDVSKRMMITNKCSSSKEYPYIVFSCYSIFLTPAESALPMPSLRNEVLAAASSLNFLHHSLHLQVYFRFYQLHPFFKRIYPRNAIMPPPIFSAQSRSCCCQNVRAALVEAAPARMLGAFMK